MRKDEFNFDVIVTAERGNYLKYKDEDLTVEKVGKPVRIIFSKKGNIPEFEELPLEDEEVEVTEEKPAKKTTRKKASK